MAAYNEPSEGIHSGNCARLNKACAITGQVILNEFSEKLRLHRLHRHHREESTSLFILHRDTVYLMCYPSCKCGPFCWASISDAQPPQESNSLGMAFLKYGVNRLLGSQGCFVFSLLGRVSLAGMFALLGSNFCLDLDLKPGRSCSVKTNVLFTDSEVTSSKYSLGIVWCTPRSEDSSIESDVCYCK